MQSSIIQKSVGILDVLSNANRPVTFTDIQRTSGFNKSTVHRLLSILTTEGLVQHDNLTKTYLLGNKLLQLVRNAAQGFEIQTIAMPEMQNLSARTRENITIGVLHGHEVVYLHVIDADYDWGLVQRPGRREPVHSTATGKSIIAYHPSDALNAWLDRHEFVSFTKNTITDRAVFERELGNIRSRGVATSQQETVDYINGIASPIFNYLGEAIASLNIWSPDFRHGYADLLEWADELKAAADRVTHRIGGEYPENYRTK